MSLVLGTHTYAASGDAARRQSQGIAVAALLRDVALVNVQFKRGAHVHPGIDTLAVLEADAVAVTGKQGPRKAIVSEIMDALCARADGSGQPFFCFMNADIQLSQDAVDWVLDGAHEVYLFSRDDRDPVTGDSRGIGTAGVDVMAVATGWWKNNRHRFRAYIAGEAVWDNVYTAIAMCHADAVLENRRPLARHEAHAAAWTPGQGPYAAYTQYLAALDAPYFSLWCEYWSRLQQLRRGNVAPAAELALARTIFAAPFSRRVRVVQAMRAVKARARYGATRFLGR